MDLDAAVELRERALDQLGLIPGPRAFALHDAVSRVVLTGGALASAARVDKAIERVGTGAAMSVGRAVHTARSHVTPIRQLFGLGVAVAGEADFRLAVRYPWRDQQLRPKYDELCDLANGEVDVDWTGPVVAQTGSTSWHRCRQRPVVIGSSIAHRHVTAGTVTAFVRHGGGDLEVLSCNHVLTLRGGSLKDPVLQPGPADSGNASHTIGHVAHVVPLEKRTVNFVDCAVAQLSTGVAANCRDLRGFGDLAGVVPPGWFGPAVDRVPVVKLGRTTGETRGKVTAFGLTQRVAYDGLGSFWFTDLVEIAGASRRRFSEAGDSGSLVFTPDGNLACGMLIAGADRKSYASKFATVLSQLGAELVTQGS